MNKNLYSAVLSSKSILHYLHDENIYPDTVGGQWFGTEAENRWIRKMNAKNYEFKNGEQRLIIFSPAAFLNTINKVAKDHDYVLFK